MLQTKGTQLLAPQLNILIDGKSIPPIANADLVAVTVLEDLEAPGMFAIEILNWDLAKSQLTWIDSDLFDCGNQVEIQMGYENQLQTLIVGEITGLEPEFSQKTVKSLIVRGHDLRHRLLRGSQTRSFTQMKDSEIANQIARASGIAAEVKDTQIKLDYVLQHNQTDLEFLQNRADRIGYEVGLEKKTLYFRPHQNATHKALTLTQDDLIEFHPRLSTMNQVGKVEVRAWDSKQKKPFVSQASVGNETTTMGGTTSGPKEANRKFNKSTHTIVDIPVRSKAEADRIALGQFNDMALAYITGEGVCLGRSALQAGKVIEITNIGKRFSGLYYVTKTIHSYSRERGYRTEFTIKRNAN